ncbi:hypothetical protein C8R47DRAFT_1069898 [Mycena vitilis]|nr:hypothetical protein C8R47DRAFT_1069898 [Mycena vitilis]
MRLERQRRRRRGGRSGLAIVRSRGCRSRRRGGSGSGSEVAENRDDEEEEDDESDREEEHEGEAVVPVRPKPMPAWRGRAKPADKDAGGGGVADEPADKDTGGGGVADEHAQTAPAEPETTDTMPPETIVTTPTETAPSTTELPTPAAGDKGAEGAGGGEEEEEGAAMWRQDTSDWSEELRNTFVGFVRGKSWGGKDWEDVVTALISLEREWGFPQQGLLLAPRSPATRPSEIMNFMRYNRKWEVPMELASEVGPRSVAKSRKAGESPDTVPCAEWAELGKMPGWNGVLLYVGALLWWGDATAKSSKAETLLAEWRLAVQDVRGTLVAARQMVPAKSNGNKAAQAKAVKKPARQAPATRKREAGPTSSTDKENVPLSRTFFCTSRADSSSRERLGVFLPDARDRRRAWGPGPRMFDVLAVSKGSEAEARDTCKRQVASLRVGMAAERINGDCVGGGMPRRPQDDGDRAWDGREGRVGRILHGAGRGKTDKRVKYTNNNKVAGKLGSRAADGNATRRTVHVLAG